MFRWSKNILRNKTLYKTGTWFFYSRKYDAPLNPFDLIYIDPSEIRFIDQNPTLVKGTCSGVVGGDWDKDYFKNEKGTFYKSLYTKIHEDISWEDTKYYQKMQNHNIWKNENDIISKLNDWEQLYYHIKKNGYKTQREVLESGELVTKSAEYNPIPELNEITVDIARDGTLIKNGGGHRLAIVKMIGLDEIPVRIKTRHFKWQSKRDKIYNSSEDISVSHPDLIF